MVRHSRGIDKLSKEGRMQSLTDKVVLITGGARRVGASAARMLHAGGARVVLHYRSARAEAQQLADELNARRPGSAGLACADLLEHGALEPMVAAAAAVFGRLDALVNNASSFFPTPIGSIGLAQWEDLVGTNLRAPLFLSQAAASHLRAARGCIINIIDIHAERPLAGHLVYSVAKAGLAGLTRALAVELAPEVRVNGVAPGPVLWPEGHGGFDADERARIVGQTLVRREGTPEDIARTVRFLLADAPYITGQILAVDGGRSIHL